MSELSSKAVCVLEMIAEGHSYAQIVECYPDLKYPDIFEAAREALDFAHESARFRSAIESASAVAAQAKKATASVLWAERLAEIKKKRLRAYEKWTDTEDARLTELFNKGTSNAVIATDLQRQTSAIESRLWKIGLKT